MTEVYRYHPYREPLTYSADMSRDDAREAARYLGSHQL